MNGPRPSTSPRGVTRWILEDDEGHRILHREDGPAEIDNTTGLCCWWNHGRRHREGAPAVFLKIDKEEGTNVPDLIYEEWWQNGQLHRVDGPAIRIATQEKWYYKGRQILTADDAREYISDPEVDVSKCQCLLEKLGILAELE